MKFPFGLVFLLSAFSNAFFLPGSRFGSAVLDSKRRVDNGEIDLSLYEKEKDLYDLEKTEE